MAGDRKWSRSYFTTRLSYSPDRERVWAAICGYVQRFVSARAAVLDLGAGYCSFINQIDAAEKHALDAFAGLDDHAGPGVTTHVGRCDDLSRFEDGRFDVVFASNLLEHLLRDEVTATLQEARRVLKVGGRVILIQPNFKYCVAEYFDDYTHQTVFTHVALADLLVSLGFRIDTMVPRFMPFSMKSRLPQWSWLVALYLRSPVRPMAKQMLIVATRREAD